MTPAIHEPAAATRAEPGRLDAALLKLAGIVVAGALASLLDTTILSVAINGLGRQFDVSLPTMQWVATEPASATWYRSSPCWYGGWAWVLRGSP